MSAVEPETGRLDRILTEPRALYREPHLPEWDLWHLTYGMWRRDGYDDVAEIERLRGMVAALEEECAALADVLNGATHDGSHPEHHRYCDLPRDHRVHRTPARVRAELEGP